MSPKPQWYLDTAVVRWLSWNQKTLFSQSWSTGMKSSRTRMEMKRRTRCCKTLCSDLWIKIVWGQKQVLFVDIWRYVGWMCYCTLPCWVGRQLGAWLSYLRGPSAASAMSQQWCPTFSVCPVRTGCCSAPLNTAWGTAQQFARGFWALSA